jgi:Protein of unknown function (DUF3309)
MLFIILILLLLFGFGGSYWGYNNYGPGGGIGIFGVILIIFLLLYFFGGLRGLR